MTIDEFKAIFKEIATEYLKNERFSYLQEMAVQLENIAMAFPNVQIENLNDDFTSYSLDEDVTFSVHNSGNLLSLEFQDLNSIGFEIESFCS